MSLSLGDTDETVYGETIPNISHRYRYLKSVVPQTLLTLPMSQEVAFDYMRECMRIDLRKRVSDARVDASLSRLEALSLLKKKIRANPRSLEDWRPPQEVKLLNIIAERIIIRDSKDLAANLDRWMHITGGPGTGKTGAIIHAAYRAAEVGARFFNCMPYWSFRTCL